MPDKEKATKLLGFRDEGGALVCPADVVDPSEVYTCHVGTEDGSYAPSDADLKSIGDLLKDVGLNGAVTKKQGKDGTVFYDKRGVVICRLVKSVAKVEEPPLPPPPESQSELLPAPEPEAAEAAESVAEAASTVKTAATVKKVFAKNGAKNGPKKAAKKKKAANKKK